MLDYLYVLTLIAVVGSGLMSGLLFAFSNFVMHALGELPAQYGQQTMQRINVRIINPVFLFVFMGSAVACALVAIGSVLHLSVPGGWWLLGGALAYLVGPFGITVAFNVPLNNSLAGATPREAGTAWPNYAARWLVWNHLRTMLAIAATALLANGLHHLRVVQV